MSQKLNIEIKPDELEPLQKPEVDPETVREIPPIPKPEIEPNQSPDEIPINRPDEFDF